MTLRRPWTDTGSVPGTCRTAPGRASSSGYARAAVSAAASTTARLERIVERMEQEGPAREVFDCGNRLRCLTSRFRHSRR